jgi:hypothetical protein
MAGATREGGAVSEQGSGRDELPQLREGAPGKRQEDLHLWHQRLLATVLLEEGECIPEVLFNRPPWAVSEKQTGTLVCSNSFRVDLNVGPEGKNRDRRNAVP